VSDSNPSLEALVEGWDGEAVVMRFDRPTACWMFIALHSSTLGPPMGGTRLRQYPTPADGLLDAMRLARGMTHKWAALEIPYGGGKGVLAVPGPLRGEARVGLLRRYGRLVESLGGGFSTGEDLGTTPRDMEILAAETSHVHGVEPEGGVRDPGPYTARGVFFGIGRAARSVLSRGVGDLSVLIQGVGDVGRPLAQALHSGGARILVSDLDDRALSWASQELQAQVVAPESVYDTECDVFAPCAIGGVLNHRTIPRLRCRLVAGSANNQLESDDDAARLHDRGIVYLPDYIVNAGGALAFALHGQGERNPEALMEAMSRVGLAVAEILEEARNRAEPPLAAAQRRVQRVLELHAHRAADGQERSLEPARTGASSLA
jgi:leucine dehydrogenase